MEPYEIIVAPFELWLAPVTTTFPYADDAPAGDWKLFGTNGKDNYSEDGVTITHEQTINQIRTLGSTGPKKVSRPSENLTMALILQDLSAEQYGKVLNGVTVTDVAAASGTPGTKDILFRMGLAVTTFALLCKGASPYGDGWSMQYQVPIVYQSANPTPVFNKGDAAGLALTFTAIEDPAAATPAESFGKLVAQYADALP